MPLASSRAALHSYRAAFPLAGDSLINRPWQSFNLSSRLTSLTEAPPGTTFTYYNLGNNGEEIATTL